MRPRATLGLRQLEVLWTVLRAGGMTRAAQELGISQPAVSRSIRAAERQLGLRLFQRDGPRLTPTPEVLELERELAQVFAHVDRTQRLGQALRQGWTRTIRLGAPCAAAASLVAPAVAALKVVEPRLKLVVRVGFGPRVEEDLALGDLDLAILQGIDPNARLTRIGLLAAPLVCVLRVGDALAARAALTVQDLIGVDLVCGGRSAVTDALDRGFAALGAERRTAVQVSDSLLAARLVQEGAGPAVVDPYFQGAGAWPGLVVRPLLPAVPVALQIAFVAERTLSAGERAVVRELRAAAQRWQAEHADPAPAAA